MRFLRWLTVVLLGLVSLGGLAGGAVLLLDPSGGRLDLAVDQLPAWSHLPDHRPLGIALIVLFGVPAAATAVLLVRRWPRGWTAASTVGVLLVLWSLGLVVLIGLRHPLVQTGYLIVGILLTGLGLDGGVITRAADESEEAEPSYEHADDEA